MNIKVIHGLKNTCIGGAANAAALYLRTELRYRDKKDGIRKFVKIIKKLFQIFFAQVKIEVTKGQKVNFEKKMLFSTITSLTWKIERFWQHRVCHVKARRNISNTTLKGQVQIVTPLKVMEVTRGHQQFFANNLRSKWDRDVGLVSLRLSPQGASNDA